MHFLQLFDWQTPASCLPVKAVSPPPPVATRGECPASPLPLSASHCQPPTEDRPTDWTGQTTTDSSRLRDSIRGGNHSLSLSLTAPLSTKQNAPGLPSPPLFYHHFIRIMEELDVPQMRREVESLQYQLAINREKSSITVTELVKWIEGCVCDDPFLNPELMRANPWVEKGKCIIL